MKTKVVDRRWDEAHPAMHGAPGGTDRMAVLIERDETYQTETVLCNNVIVLAAQYPARTDYAARRVAKWAA